MRSGWATVWIPTVCMGPSTCEGLIKGQMAQEPSTDPPPPSWVAAQEYVELGSWSLCTFIQNLSTNMATQLSPKHPFCFKLPEVKLEKGSTVLLKRL